MVGGRGGGIRRRGGGPRRPRQLFVEWWGARAGLKGFTGAANAGGDADATRWGRGGRLPRTGAAIRSTDVTVNRYHCRYWKGEEKEKVEREGGQKGGDAWGGRRGGRRGALSSHKVELGRRRFARKGCGTKAPPPPRAPACPRGSIE